VARRWMRWPATGTTSPDPNRSPGCRISVTDVPRGASSPKVRSTRASSTIPPSTCGDRVRPMPGTRTTERPPPARRTAAAVAPSPDPTIRISETISLISALQLRDQGRNDVEQVADDPEVSHLEDGRVRVLVDRDDVLAVLHAPGMLRRTADSHRKVQLRPDHDAGGANLPVMGEHPLEHRRARAADRRIEGFGELLDEPDSLLVLHATTARDDPIRVGQLRAGLHRRIAAGLGRKLRENVLQCHRIDVAD